MTFLYQKSRCLIEAFSLHLKHLLLFLPTTMYEGSEKHILSLDTMPKCYQKYEKEPWKSRGLRVLPVDNYVVLYIPDSNKKVVTILRVMYAGRDIDNQLNLHTKQ